MAKLLVMLITGKENINTEMVALNFAINSALNAHATVEILLLGRGLEAGLSGQSNSSAFDEQFKRAISLGIPVKACSVSMRSLGIPDDGIFPYIERVMGGVEVNSRVEEGYHVITF